MSARAVVSPRPRDSPAVTPVGGTKQPFPSEGVFSVLPLRLYVPGDTDGPADDWTAETANENVKIMPVTRRVPLNNDDPLVACAVVMRIGQKLCRVLLDSGAVHSMIRSRVAEQFHNNADTKEAMGERSVLNTPFNCEGAEKGRVVGKVTHKDEVTLGFPTPDLQKTGLDTEAFSPAARKLRSELKQEQKDVVWFYELGELSDPLIIGRPDLTRWGFYMEPEDQNGRLWIQFTALNLRLPVLRKPPGQAGGIRVAHPVELEGPDAQAVEVSIDRAALQQHS